jgi:DNA polymerase-3 subunit alpha
MVKQYVECKHGRSRPEYPHPLLEGILRETHGVILYQEQVMQCASILAGYTLGEADLLRRAMGKKKVEVMRQQREKFVSGAAKNGIEAKTAEHVFDLIEEFAGYGFNKSHSAAYAVIAYQTAYLKANYRSEFMAAHLSSQMRAKKEVLGRCVREVRRSGTEVLPPDINSSMGSFTAVGDVIRFGLAAVAKVGHNAVAAIAEARKNGKFTSLWDFISRVDLQSVSKSAIENLIKAGAFDEITPNRARLAAALPDFVLAFQKRTRDDGQYSIFDLMQTPEEAEEPDMPETEDYEAAVRLEFEKEVMGIYISGHPFDGYEEKAGKYATCTMEELSYWRGAAPAKVGGIILSVTDKITRAGKPMGIINFEDSDGSVEMVSFPNSWETMKAQIQIGKPYIAEGKMGDREPRSFILDKLTPLEGMVKDVSANPELVRIRLRADALPPDLSFKNFAVALRDCSGRSPVLLELADDRDSCVLSLQGFNVSGADPVRERLAEVVPAGAFEVV